MSTIALPELFAPLHCRFKSVVNQRVNASPFGGSEQAIDMLNDRWTCSVELDSLNNDDAASIEAFINAMRGQTNVCNLWHFARPVPRGTVRGALTAAAAAQGAASLVISGCTPSTGTLKAGDMLGLGGLLLMVASDCTAVAGTVTVPLVNRLRKTVSGTVTWDKPTAPFRLLNSSDVQYGLGVSDPVSLDFGEYI